jgi:hypothetical protein
MRNQMTTRHVSPSVACACCGRRWIPSDHEKLAMYHAQNRAKWACSSDCTRKLGQSFPPVHLSAMLHP